MKDMQAGVKCWLRVVTDPSWQVTHSPLRTEVAEKPSVGIAMVVEQLRARTSSSSNSASALRALRVSMIWDMFAVVFDSPVRWLLWICVLAGCSQPRCACVSSAVRGRLLAC